LPANQPKMPTNNVQIRPQKHIRPNNGKVKGSDTKRLAAIEMKKDITKHCETKSNQITLILAKPICPQI